MTLELNLVMTDQEVKKYIAYNVICMTRYGQIWNTMYRKIKWEKEFSEIERLKAEKIFCQAHKWSVGYGIPHTVKFDMDTYLFWKKIEAFCMSFY